jgi:Protein of unknown function (DUF2924)
MTTHENTTIAQLTQLPQLSMERLWALWDELFDRRPGHHQRTYLESRIAYKLQERAFGGLPGHVRRKLEQIGETGEIPNQKRRAESELAPGTTLVREYNGITYRVRVLDDGRFDLDGRPFKSLSAVARAITGTVYSGPVFFGLKPTSRERKAARA